MVRCKSRHTDPRGFEPTAHHGAAISLDQPAFKLHTPTCLYALSRSEFQTSQKKTDKVLRNEVARSHYCNCCSEHGRHESTRKENRGSVETWHESLTWHDMRTEHDIHENITYAPFKTHEMKPHDMEKHMTCHEHMAFNQHCMSWKNMEPHVIGTTWHGKNTLCNPHAAWHGKNMECKPHEFRTHAFGRHMAWPLFVD